MFSNLSKGNVLYGVDRSNDGMRFFTATIEDAKPAFPLKVGQMPGTVMDITALKDGETLSFKQLPSNNAVADYGANGFLLADSKDSLVNYINAKLQASRNIVNSYEEHKKLIERYESLLGDITPNVNGKEISELRHQMSAMQGQFQELMTMLKGKQQTTT